MHRHRVPLALAALILPLLPSACSSAGGANGSTSTSASVTSSSAGGGGASTSSSSSGAGAGGAGGASTSSSSSGGGGAGGTGGASASSSTSSSTSSSASSSSSTSTSSTSTGGSSGCTFGDPTACPAGQYCKATNCQTGTCVALPVGSGNKSPVCGCDGVTYWNSATAGSQGMSIAHSGMCTPGTACGGPSNLQCAAGQACNIMLADPSDCATPSPSGQCWGMPATCPLVIGSTNSTSCDNAMVCADVCGAIQHGTPWFADGTCPL